MSAQKLRSLKVVELRSILSKAELAVPARATKADLVTRILASEHALHAFRALYPSLQDSSTTVPTLTESPVPTPSRTPQPPPPVPAADPQPTPENPATDPEAEKRKQRADRFGVPSNTHGVDPELEKRQKRAERFGIPLVAAPKSKQSDDADKLKARTARFGTAGQKRAAPGDAADADELERRKKRAERFGLTVM